MSDINDLIARNAVMAYNSGYEMGKHVAEERFLRVLKDVSVSTWDDKEYAYLEDIMSCLEDEDY